jgi:hypothetical protein
MAHIRIINEDEATGQLAEDYKFISGSYSKLSGTHMPTPQVYRTNSILPPYFHFGAIQNEVLTYDGRPIGPLPDILVNFALSMFSSCYY